MFFLENIRQFDVNKIVKYLNDYAQTLRVLHAPSELSFMLVLVLQYFKAMQSHLQGTIRKERDQGLSIGMTCSSISITYEM